MAPDTAVILAALPVVPLHTVAGSVIVPGVAGLSVTVNVVTSLAVLVQPVFFATTV